MELRIVFDLLHPVGRNVVDHVHFAGAQTGQPHRRFGHFARKDAVEIGGPAPVIVEPHQLDLVTEFAPHELERTGADRRFALLIAGALRHDRAGAVFREAAQERRVDAIHLDDECEVVGRFDRGDVVEHLEIDRAGRLVAAAIEGIFGVRRRHRLAVVELHAGPQVERIDEPVLALIEALGEARDHREVLVDGDDGVVDILQHPDRRGGAGLVDVQVLRRLRVAPDERAAFDRSVAGERRAGPEASANRRPADQRCGRFQEISALHRSSPIVSKEEG